MKKLGIILLSLVSLQSSAIQIADAIKANDYLSAYRLLRNKQLTTQEQVKLMALANKAIVKSKKECSLLGTNQAKRQLAVGLIYGTISAIILRPFTTSKKFDAYKSTIDQSVYDAINPHMHASQSDVMRGVQITTIGWLNWQIMTGSLLAAASFIELRRAVNAHTAKNNLQNAQAVLAVIEKVAIQD